MLLQGLLEGFDVAGMVSAANARGLLDIRQQEAGDGGGGSGGPGNGREGEGVGGSSGVGSTVTPSTIMFDIPAELGGASGGVPGGHTVPRIPSTSPPTPTPPPPPVPVASPLTERLFSLAALGWSSAGAQGPCSRLYETLICLSPQTYYAAALGMAVRHHDSTVRAAMLRTLGKVPLDVLPRETLFEGARQLGVALARGWVEHEEISDGVLEGQLLGGAVVWEALVQEMGGGVGVEHNSGCLTLAIDTPAGVWGWGC